MTKTHLHLPSVEQLKKYVEDRGVKEAIKRYSGYEFLIGSTESLNYLEEITREYKKGVENERI